MDHSTGFCASGPGVTLRDQFDCKVLEDDGTPSKKFLINEEFIASLGYLVAACLWPSITEARNQTQYYQQRVAYYQYHHWREARRNRRDDLYECLHAWQALFPPVVRNRRSIPVSSAPAKQAVVILAGWV